MPVAGSSYVSIDKLLFAASREAFVRSDDMDLAEDLREHANSPILFSQRAIRRVGEHALELFCGLVRVRIEHLDAADLAKAALHNAHRGTHVEYLWVLGRCFDATRQAICCKRGGQYDWGVVQQSDERREGECAPGEVDGTTRNCGTGGRGTYTRRRPHTFASRRGPAWGGLA